MSVATVYKLKVRSYTWNGVTKWRPYVLSNGRWQRYDTSEFPDRGSAYVYIETIAEDYDDFEVVQ